MERHPIEKIINEIVEQQGWKLDTPIWEGGIDTEATDAELAPHRILAESRDACERDTILLFIDYQG